MEVDETNAEPLWPSWDELIANDASDLTENRKVLSKFKSDAQNRKSKGTVYKLVLDANFIWNEIGHYLSFRKEPSALTELKKSGLCEFHAPTWLLKELETSVFPNLAKHHRISPFVLNAIFNEFVRSNIRFHSGYVPPIGSVSV